MGIGVFDFETFSNQSMPEENQKASRFRPAFLGSIFYKKIERLVLATTYFPP